MEFGTDWNKNEQYKHFMTRLLNPNVFFAETVNNNRIF